MRNFAIAYAAVTGVMVAMNGFILIAEPSQFAATGFFACTVSAFASGIFLTATGRRSLSEGGKE